MPRYRLSPLTGFVGAREVHDLAARRRERHVVIGWELDAIAADQDHPTAQIHRLGATVVQRDRRVLEVARVDGRFRNLDGRRGHGRRRGDHGRRGCWAAGVGGDGVGMERTWALAAAARAWAPAAAERTPRAATVRGTRLNAASDHSGNLDGRDASATNHDSDARGLRPRGVGFEGSSIGETSCWSCRCHWPRTGSR